MKRFLNYTILIFLTLLLANVVDCCVLGETKLVDMMRVGVPIMPALSPPNITLQPQSIADSIANPGMGWQNTYDAPLRFEQSTLYRRFNWNDVHLAPDLFDWTVVEEMRSRLQKPSDKISFRVRPAQPPRWGTGHTMPDWVVALGVPIFDDDRGTEPLYHSCLYLETQGDFVDAMRLQYDGDPDVGFIDIGSYGQYGEWWTDQYDDTKNTLDWHARRRILDMYLGGSGERPCLDKSGREEMVAYAYVGFQQTQLVLPYTPWFDDSLFYATDKRADVGIRHDALGSADHQERYEIEAGSLVQQRWRTAPIVFEFARDAHTPEALDLAYDFATDMHASLVHDNFGGAGEDAGIQRIIADIGYRLELREFSWRTPVRESGLLSFLAVFENAGIAPPYLDYRLHVNILDDREYILHTASLPIDLRQWLPHEPIRWRGDLLLPPELNAGIYPLELALVDNAGNPAIFLANTGQDQAGWMKLGELEIIE